MTTAYSELGLQTPWLNAAGSLGFAPPPVWSWPEKPGGFITNPISWKPRAAGEGRTLIPYAGGFLLHSGWPNPGLSAVLRQHGERWARSRLPIWVHLLANQPDELYRMVRQLEENEGVAAIEVGIPPFATHTHAIELLQSAVGELPVVLQFPLTLLSEDWVEDLTNSGLTAVSVGPPRGTLRSRQGRLISGRLYGPALLPLVFRAVAIANRSGLPVIASGGVQRLEDGQSLLASGAAAVALDSVLWKS